MIALFSRRATAAAWHALAVVGLLCVVSCGVGCDRQSAQDDPLIGQWRGRLLSPTAAANPVSLTQLAEQLGMTAADGGAAAADDSSDSAAAADSATATDSAAAEPTAPAVDGSASVLPAGSEVVVVGRIFAGDMQPFEAGKAAFVLTELPEEGHGAGHDPDTCPFCKRRAAKQPSAIVRFLDESGQPIPLDARKLLGLNPKDVVVIRGTATPGQMNTILIDASELSVRGS